MFIEGTMKLGPKKFYYDWREESESFHLAPLFQKSKILNSSFMFRVVKNEDFISYEDVLQEQIKSLDVLMGSFYSNFEEFFSAFKASVGLTFYILEDRSKGCLELTKLVIDTIEFAKKETVEENVKTYFSELDDVDLSGKTMSVKNTEVNCITLEEQLSKDCFNNFKKSLTDETIKSIRFLARVGRMSPSDYVTNLLETEVTNRVDAVRRELELLDTTNH